MRLIDADLLAEKIAGWLKVVADKNVVLKQEEAAEIILMEIEAQPTAYNVSKVVESLEDRVKKNKKAAQILENTGMESHSRKMYAKAYSYEDAVKIVKRGGINV